MQSKSSNYESIYKNNIMQVLIQYTQTRFLIVVYQMQGGQKIKIFQGKIDSLKNFQLLATRCQSFKDLKQYLKKQDAFIFDFDSKNMIIYGKDSNTNNQCVELATLDFEIIPQLNVDYDIDNIISYCEKSQQELKQSQIKTFFKRIAQCIKNEVLDTNKKFKSGNFQSQQLDKNQQVSKNNEQNKNQKKLPKQLQQQISISRKTIETNINKSLMEVDKKFQKLHDSYKQEINAELQQIRDEFDDLLKIKLEKMDQQLKISRQLQKVEKNLTKKINEVNTNLTKTLILQEDTISKLIKKIQSNYITISQQLLEHSQIQINCKKQISRIDSILSQNTASMQKNNKCANTIGNKQQGNQMKQTIQKLQSKVQVLEEQFETMVQLQTQRLNDKLQLELHKINLMIYQLKNNQKGQFKMVQLKQKLTSIQSTQSLQPETQPSSYAEDWIDKECFHYRNVIYDGNKITSKCEARVFGKKKIVDTCQITVGILKMTKWIAICIAAEAIKLKQAIDPKQPNRIVYLSQGVSFDGQEMKHNQGLGFVEGEQVTMTVDLSKGRIEWKVKNQVRHWLEKPNLKEIAIQWVPYICLPNANDCISISQTP